MTLPLAIMNPRLFYVLFSVFEVSQLLTPWRYREKPFQLTEVFYV